MVCATMHTQFQRRHPTWRRCTSRTVWRTWTGTKTCFSHSQSTSVSKGSPQHNMQHYCLIVLYDALPRGCMVVRPERQGARMAASGKGQLCLKVRIWADGWGLGAHAQRGLWYLVCHSSLCLSACLLSRFCRYAQQNGQKALPTGSVPHWLYF